MINDIYNTEVLRLAAGITRIDPLDEADARVQVRSPLCGSTMEVAVRVEDGRIADYAHDIKACALGQAVASVMARAVVGKDADEIRRVRGIMEAMLTSEGPPPDGDWSPLEALQPAKDATSRHGAILLPFDAVLKAFDEVESGAVPA